MPVLSFPCTIHRASGGPRPVRQRVWIKGHDLRTLALAATRHLGVTATQCRYGLVSPDCGNLNRVFLEVTCPERDALIGPMAAPLPTPAIAEQALTLDALLDSLGFTDLRNDATSKADNATDDAQRHLVLVTWSPICGHQRFPPRREPRESGAQYRRRCDLAERQRIERISQQGIHIVRYDVPPDAWTAQDLEALMVLVYRLLPENEPRWRDTGTISQARFIDPANGRVTLAHGLQVGRGDYIAHLRLPTFPTLALAEWLRYRHCDIRLRQPVMRLELISRGWRYIERIDATREARSTVEDLAGWYPPIDPGPGATLLLGDQEAAAVPAS